LYDAARSSPDIFDKLILIIGGLTFFPALALGPIVEHLANNANTLF